MNTISQIAQSIIDTIHKIEEDDFARDINALEDDIKEQLIEFVDATDEKELSISLANTKSMTDIDTLMQESFGPEYDNMLIDIKNKMLSDYLLREEPETTN